MGQKIQRHLMLNVLQMKISPLQRDLGSSGSPGLMLLRVGMNFCITGTDSKSFWLFSGIEDINKYSPHDEINLTGSSQSGITAYSISSPGTFQPLYSSCKIRFYDLPLMK